MRETKTRLLTLFVLVVVATAMFAGLAMPSSALAATKPTVTVTRANTGKVTLKKGASYKLSAKASKGAKLSYKSSKPGVVLVTKKGVLKAKKAGKATVTVTVKAGSRKAVKKIQVTVVSKAKYKKVTKIAVKPAKATLKVGKSLTLKTTFTPKKASNRNLIYKSSNTSVAKITAKGKVTARKAGKAKITVTSADNSKAKRVVTVTVKAADEGGSSDSGDDPASGDVAVESVTVEPAGAALTVGDTLALKATVSPSGAADKTVTYASSDEGVLEVSASGVVTAKAPGAATVTVASASNPKASCTAEIVVKAQVADPAPAPDGDGIEKAAYDEAATTVSLAHADVSDDGTAATVDAGVLAQAPAEGQVVVIADENLQGTAIKVESVTQKADGGYAIEGSQPEFEEVFDELSIERSQGFTEDDITWMEEGVELETGGTNTSGARKAPAQKSGGTIGGNAIKFKLTKDFWEKKGFGDKLTGEFSGEFQIKVTPSMDWALDYNGLAITRLKVMPELDTKIAGALQLGVTLKVPIAKFDVAGTGFTLYFVMGADGSYSLDYEVDVAAGIDWTKGKQGFFNYEGSAEGNSEFSATGKIGLDAQAKVGLLCFEIGSFDVEAGGAASGTLNKHGDSLWCSDVDAWVYAQASYKVEDFIAMLGGIDAEFTKEFWNKSTSPLRMSTMHFENGHRVSECTWEEGNVPEIPGVARKTSLSEYSWGELKAIANAIAAAPSDAEGLAIAKSYDLVDTNGKLTGETKDVEVQGLGTARVRICGFRHDERADGTGRAGITFEFANAVGMHLMNATDTNSGGWEASKMRSWLNGEFLSNLPSSLVNSIASVRKATNNAGGDTGGNTSVVTQTTDKLWLLSLSEVYGMLSSQSSSVPTYPAVYDAEGTQYQLYADQGVSTASYGFCKKTGFGSWWWLRSPSACNSSTFFNVGDDGDWGSSFADNTPGVAPGFCF